MWDSHSESIQLLTPGAARSQPSLEGERGRLAAVLSICALANSELLLSCGVVQQPGNRVGMWIGWESYFRARVLRGEHLTPPLSSLPSQQPCWAGQSSADLYLIQDPEKGLVPSDKLSRHQASFYNKKWFKGSLSLLFSPLLRASPALPNPYLPGRLSGYHHTPKDSQIFLSHLFRTMLMVRRTRPKIMVARESARTE